jgi:hypothetical protein
MAHSGEPVERVKALSTTLGRARHIVPVIACSLALAAGLLPSNSAFASNCEVTSVGFTPLNDLGAGTYKGSQGGLYPGGLNQDPATHVAQGRQLADQVVPRLPNGTPDAVGGKIVFLSIGMSNTSIEFSHFITKANADPQKDSRVLLVDGAVPGGAAEEFADPSSTYWQHSDDQLKQAGGYPAQVQAVWLKETLKHPTVTWPADANLLRDDLHSIVHILKQKYPNLWLVYLSSRIYAGYAETNLSPEPHAYQGGFSVKWLIQDQLQGKMPVSATTVPWLGWGPYMWADGLKPRSDGLTWECHDFDVDGTHPAAGAVAKVDNMLMSFVHNDATASIWYKGTAAPGGGLLGGLCNLLPNIIC